MICINRINSWYSNTLVAIAEPLDDDGWDVFIRGLVAPIDNHVIDKKRYILSQNKEALSCKHTQKKPTDCARQENFF